MSENSKPEAAKDAPAVDENQIVASGARLQALRNQGVASPNDFRAVTYVDPRNAQENQRTIGGRACP
jgi:hypothetical protein